MRKNNNKTKTVSYYYYYVRNDIENSGENSFLPYVVVIGSRRGARLQDFYRLTHYNWSVGRLVVLTHVPCVVSPLGAAALGGLVVRRPGQLTSLGGR